MPSTRKLVQFKAHVSSSVLRFICAALLLLPRCSRRRLPRHQVRFIPVVFISRIVLSLLLSFTHSPPLSFPVKPLRSNGHASARDERGLLALYELPRVECHARRFSPSVDVAGLGVMQADAVAAACGDGVGLSAPPARARASAVSTGDLARLLPRLRETRALSIELWLRPSSAAGRPSSAAATLQPILAFGAPAAASDGLRSADGCRDGQYALMIAQEGSLLRVDLRSAEFVQRRNAWLCLQVEVDSALPSGAVFESAEELYHVVISARPKEPLIVHVNGIQLPDLFLAANPLAEGDQPLDVQYEHWSHDLKLLVAPLLSDPPRGGHNNGANETTWDGAIHMLALYDRALSTEQITTNYNAFVRDSAPIAPPTRINGVEDTPLVVQLKGIDPFDQRYRPSHKKMTDGAGGHAAAAAGNKVGEVYIASLPKRNGTLHLPSWSGPPPLCEKSKRSPGVCKKARRRSLSLFEWSGEAATAAAAAKDACGDVCPYSSRAIRASDLPLRLPHGWVWFEPATDAYSQADGTTPADTFEYFVDDGTQRSEYGTASIHLAPINDPPVAVPTTVHAFSGVAQPFVLDAVDADSALSTATLISIPTRGTLHAMPISDTGATDEELAPAAARTPALRAGAELPAGEWRLVYLHTPGDEDADSGRGGTSDVLLNDRFTFRACDVHNACSLLDAPINIVVHNALRASSGESIVTEETPAVLRLSGIDERGSRLRYVLSKAPEGGTLYPCIPPPTLPPSPPPASPPSPSRPPTYAAYLTTQSVEEVPSGAVPCCLEPSCLQDALQPGRPLSTQDGRLVYLPPTDYFNCAPRNGRSCAPAIAPMMRSKAAARIEGAAPDAFAFYVVDVVGRRSADATHKVWVRNINDAPRWLGTHEMTAEALTRTPLPHLKLYEPDGDSVRWEVQLRAVYGFLSLPPHILNQLSFTLGDGTSDRIVRMSGMPSAILSAIKGASYRAIEEGHNDTISVSIADPHGASLKTIGTLNVHVTPSTSSAATPDDLGVNAPAAIALWVVIGAVLLLCGVQVFAWLQRCCHPEAAEKEANYRYLQELEAEEDEKAAKQKADDLAGKNTNPLSARSSRSSEGSPRKEPQEVSIRQWALQQNRGRSRATPRAISIPPPQQVAESSADPTASDVVDAEEGASAPVGTTAGMLAMVFKGRPHSQPSQPTVGGGVSPAIAQRVAALHESGGVTVGVRVPPLPLRAGGNGTAAAPAPLEPDLFDKSRAAPEAARVVPELFDRTRPSSSRGATTSQLNLAIPDARGQFGPAASARASPRGSTLYDWSLSPRESTTKSYDLDQFTRRGQAPAGPSPRASAPTAAASSQDSEREVTV